MGGIILGLFMVASFISLYLTPVKKEPDVSSVPEKAEPQQPPQPPPPIEAPRQEKAVAPEPAPRPPVEPARAEPRKPAGTPKTEKPAKKVVPKTSQPKIDRPLEPQRGKSFAPHSRDDLDHEDTRMNLKIPEILCSIVALSIAVILAGCTYTGTVKPGGMAEEQQPRLDFPEIKAYP